MNTAGEGITTTEMIERFQKAIGREEFEKIELEDYTKIDAFAASIGYLFDDKQELYLPNSN